VPLPARLRPAPWAVSVVLWLCGAMAVITEGEHGRVGLRTTGLAVTVDRAPPGAFAPNLWVVSALLRLCSAMEVITEAEHGRVGFHTTGIWSRGV